MDPAIVYNSHGFVIRQARESWLHAASSDNGGVLVPMQG